MLRHQKTSSQTRCLWSAFANTAVPPLTPAEPPCSKNARRKASSTPPRPAAAGRRGEALGVMDMVRAEEMPTGGIPTSGLYRAKSPAQFPRTGPSDSLFRRPAARQGPPPRGSQGVAPQCGCKAKTRRRFPLRACIAHKARGELCGLSAQSLRDRTFFKHPSARRRQLPWGSPCAALPRRFKATTRGRCPHWARIGHEKPGKSLVRCTENLPQARFFNVLPPATAQRRRQPDDALDLDKQRRYSAGSIPIGGSDRTPDPGEKRREQSGGFCTDLLSKFLAIPRRPPPQGLLRVAPP